MFQSAGGAKAPVGIAMCFGRSGKFLFISGVGEHGLAVTTGTSGMAATDDMVRGIGLPMGATGVSIMLSYSSSDSAISSGTSREPEDERASWLNRNLRSGEGSLE
jgi:hypothetical protein